MVFNESDEIKGEKYLNRCEENISVKLKIVCEKIAFIHY